LREVGAAGDASDITVKCLECGVERRMADAFETDIFQIRCSGHHPHLRKTDASGCQENARTILLGASNSWFPIVMSALSLPPLAKEKLAVLVSDQWAALMDIPSLEVARYATAPSRLPAL